MLATGAAVALAIAPLILKGSVVADMVQAIVKLIIHLFLNLQHTLAALVIHLGGMGLLFVLERNKSIIYLKIACTMSATTDPFKISGAIMY